MTYVDPFADVARRLNTDGVRYVMIGVWGANYYAPSASFVFTTEDRDLFLPPDTQNLLTAWNCCADAGLSLWCGDEPLGLPRDAVLADGIIARRVVTLATDAKGLDVDLTLLMAGFDFETVWRERREFLVDGVEVSVARLSHIVDSKARAGRKKDLMFIETHMEALKQMGYEPPAEGDITR